MLKSIDNQRWNKWKFRPKTWLVVLSESPCKRLAAP